MAKPSHQAFLRHLLLRPPDVAHHGWVPAADVYELHAGWLIKVELAGIRPQDVTVTLEGDVLRIVGRRRDWVAHEARGCRSLEISYERFERTFDLGGIPQGSRIVTEYRDGMLLIKVLPP
ncbi:MAG TPA: Hsp20/alpha crystallin family protein [Planctomycetaceae bacterium]|nr:Hsp20/alpha crystallin family protein [Planctomycetaceae bacterium]